MCIELEHDVEKKMAMKRKFKCGHCKLFNFSWNRRGGPKQACSKCKNTNWKQVPLTVSAFAPAQFQWLIRFPQYVNTHISFHNFSTTPTAPIKHFRSSHGPLCSNSLTLGIRELNSSMCSM